MFALLLLGLVGFVALSIDGGYIMAERRQTQNAADAAALAAAKAIEDRLGASAVQAAAQSYGSLNAGANSAVSVSWPPSTGRFAGDAGYVQVTVTKQVRRFFVGAVYNGPWQVSASAVAGIEPEGFNAALLALNSNEGGIQTSGSTQIRVIGGSVVSNYDINTSGSTSITADEYVVADDGFHTSGATVIDGGRGERNDGPEVPDPLADKISPPNLPSFPGDPVNSVNPPNGTCQGYGEWNGGRYSVPPGTYSGGSSCINVQNIVSRTLEFQQGQYRFNSGAGISIGGGNSRDIIMRGGTYNFLGGGRISIGGSTPHFEMQHGNYSFRGNNGGISIGGSAPNNILGGGNFYFGDGATLRTGGSNFVTLNPGTYIFDGGQGLTMSGSDRLHFNSGTYELWFRNGADFAFSGSSRITHSGNVYIRAYFYGGSGSNWSDMQMSGSTSFNIPPGEYYFDHGRFINSGSTLITGNDVFLYFNDGGYLSSTGSASFGFTAPTRSLYPGYYPGVFMYSDASNTATFEWHGSTSAVSRGTVYLPSSPVLFGGASHGKQFEGQFIADRFITGGSTGLTVEFVEYVQTQIPKVYLVD
jgi:Flp pilus assembly protein TadG